MTTVYDIDSDATDIEELGENIAQTTTQSWKEISWPSSLALCEVPHSSDIHKWDLSTNQPDTVAGKLLVRHALNYFTRYEDKCWPIYSLRITLTIDFLFHSVRIALVQV
jgi:hypothetical protein